MAGAAMLLALAGAAGAADGPKPCASAVRFSSDPGVSLAGELRVPPSPRGTRPPIVLLLGGGGESPHGIYPELEARLLSHGIATFSFDKRGVGASTGRFDDAMPTARRDAAAALAYVRSRRDVIDPGRLAILGLSQGGMLAPTLAVESPPVAAVVTLAAPVGERGTLFLAEMRVKLAASGMGAAATERVTAATGRYLDALTTTAPAGETAARRKALVAAFVAAGWSPGQAEGAVTTLGDPATASLYTVAARAVFERVEAPMLMLYAADDTVVSSATSLPVARAMARRRRDVTVAEMPNVEHGFKPLVVAADGSRDYRGWPISDPATLARVETWLTARLPSVSLPTACRAG